MTKVSISAQQLAQANRIIADIRRALKDIGDYYEPVLTSPRQTDASGIRAGSSGEPVNINALDTRAETYNDLHFWCRFILDEINEGTIRTVVRPAVPDMIAFISRWVVQIVDQFPDDADNLRREMGRHAHHLEMLSRGWTVRRIEVGRCPEQRLVVVPGNDGLPVETFVPCTGTLWALLRSQDVLLPKKVGCDLEDEHQWAPWQWPALGRRIGTSDIA